jgi:hypothetical protein
MSTKGRAWQTLTPGNLPTSHLDVRFGDSNPIRDLAGFPFEGFVRQGADGPLRGDEDGANFDDVSLAASLDAGCNHYGPVYRIRLDTSTLSFEEYNYDWECQDTAMEVLRYLIVELGRTCTWEASREYYDSGEYRGPNRGTHEELRALFSVTLNSRAEPESS